MDARIRLIWEEERSDAILEKTKYLREFNYRLKGCVRKYPLNASSKSTERGIF